MGLKTKLIGKRAAIVIILLILAIIGLGFVYYLRHT